MRDPCKAGSNTSGGAQVSLEGTPEGVSESPGWWYLQGSGYHRHSPTLSLKTGSQVPFFRSAPPWLQSGCPLSAGSCGRDGGEHPLVA